MEEKKERRAEPRVELVETATFKTMSEGERDAVVEYKTSKITNVSEHGLCAEFEARMKAGDIVRLNFFHEGTGMSEHDAIKAFCEVLWSRAADKGMYKTGLQFISIKDEDAKKLADYVLTHQKQHRAF